MRAVIFSAISVSVSVVSSSVSVSVVSSSVSVSVVFSSIVSDSVDSSDVSVGTTSVSTDSSDVSVGIISVSVDLSDVSVGTTSVSVNSSDISVDSPDVSVVPSAVVSVCISVLSFIIEISDAYAGISTPDTDKIPDNARHASFLNNFCFMKSPCLSQLIPCENVVQPSKNLSPKVILHGFLPVTGTERTVANVNGIVYYAMHCSLLCSPFLHF